MTSYRHPSLVLVTNGCVEVWAPRAAQSRSTTTPPDLDTTLASDRAAWQLTQTLSQAGRGRSCPLCDGLNRDSARFCRYCGAALPHVPEAQQANDALVVAARTHIGRQRQINEDTVLARRLAFADATNACLCLVADGLGDHNDGAEASKRAAEVACTVLLRATALAAPSTNQAWHALLAEAVCAANGEVYRSQPLASAHAMGTTLTLAVVVGARAYIAHVGRSRAYHLQHATATLAQITNVHPVAQPVFGNGNDVSDALAAQKLRGVLRQSLGQAMIDIEQHTTRLARGDALLLCSDSLAKHSSDAEIGEVVSQAALPQAACARLIGRAQEQGSEDTISVVLACMPLPAK